MKINTILSIVAGLFMTVQVVAQTSPTPPANNGNMSRREKLADTTPEQRASQQTARMKKQLALTAEQEPTVAAASKDAELKTVFTADQYKQYDTFRDEQKDRLKEMRGKRNNR
jgi:hypothetical protein